MKKYRVNVNGSVYEVEIEEISASAATAKSAAPAAAAAKPAAAAAPVSSAPAGGQKINAPMPGTILDVRVQSGSTVKKGDILFILEAMKMENEILAPRDGTVAQVVTSKGSVVDTGAPLVVLA